MNDSHRRGAPTSDARHRRQGDTDTRSVPAWWPLRRRRRTSWRTPTSTLLRRVTAVALFIAAAALALQPAEARDEPTSPMLVTSGELDAGHVLTDADVEVTTAAEDGIPSGALASVDPALGRILTSSARPGEPLTDARLVGIEGEHAKTPPGMAAVPIRLSDAGIAEVLHPGATVDVITLESADQERQVLATEATVVTITETDGDEPMHGIDGRLVLIALPTETASEVAAVSLHQPVTVTLR